MLLFGQRRLETLIGGIANWSQNWIQASSLWVYAPPLQTVPIIGLINTQWLQACLKNYRECLQNCLWSTIIGTYNDMYHLFPSILIPEKPQFTILMCSSGIRFSDKIPIYSRLFQGKKTFKRHNLQKRLLLDWVLHTSYNKRRQNICLGVFSLKLLTYRSEKAGNPIILRCKSFGAFPTFLVVFYSSCLDARCKITKISSTYFYYIAPGFDFCKQNIL